MWNYASGCSRVNQETAATDGIMKENEFAADVRRNLQPPTTFPFPEE